MEPILLFLSVVIVFALLEFFAFRAYRKHKAKKESLFTKERLGEVYDNLQSTYLYFLEEKHVLDMLAEMTDKQGKKSDRETINAMIAGTQSRLDKLDELRTRLDAEEVICSSQDFSMLFYEDILRKYAERKFLWADGICPTYGTKAQAQRLKDIVKLYKQFQQVERNYGYLYKGLADDASVPASDLSLCPTCGNIIVGRYPAFCEICGQPGFEYIKVQTLSNP